MNNISSGWVCVLFFVFGLVQGRAQSDFGLDLSLSADKALTDNLGLAIEAGTRTQDTSRSFERISAGASLDYKFLNTKRFDLKASLGWEYIWQQRLGEEETTRKGNLKTTDPFWRRRHRTTLGIEAEYKPNKRWTLSLREAVQYNHYFAATTTEYKYDRKVGPQGEYYDYDDPDIQTKHFDVKDRFVLRSRLALQYDIRRSPFAPYASIDYGCGLNYSADKWKLSIGTDIKLAKQHRLDICYRYMTENDDDDPKGHLLCVGYKYKF